MSRLAKILIAAGAVVVLLLALVVAGWYFFIRSDPEPRAEIVETETTTGGELDGTYTIVTGPPETSTFDGYRVTEQLVSAVIEQETTGRTPDVTGTFTISGDTVDQVNLTANLLNLQSDNGQRDNTIRTRGLESERFPEATFVLTEPIELPAAPEVGETVTATAIGDLTLHGVTRSVRIAVEGRWDGALIQVVGNLPIVFADYDMETPNIGGFVTVKDEGEMEFQIFFQKA